MKKLCVLGITGSIGKNVADIVKQNRDDFEIVGVALNSNVGILFEILLDHPTIKYVYVSCNESKAKILAKYPHLNVYTKEDSFKPLLDAYDYDMVVNALVGFVGLEPTIQALEHKKNVALANKETLVVAGHIIKDLLKKEEKKED